MPKKEKFSVVIVDDHDVFRAGVKAMLDEEKFEIIGEADSVDNGIAVILETRPDVVLLDVHLQDGLAADLLFELKNRISTNYLALSVSDSAQDVGATIRAGALGYITKTTSKEELNSALEQVASGYAVFSPKLAAFVLNAFASDSSSSKTVPDRKDLADDDEFNSLSLKQREVLQLIARGYSYKEIAGELFITAKTVESHVSAVLRKLQLSNRTEITRWAMKRGLD